MAFVPPVIREKLARLHDDMPPMPSAQAQDTLHAEIHALQQPLGELAPLEFDSSSLLGSASIAEVHRGTLASSGRPVAIKLQNPHIERLMMGDLANFRILGEILQRTELNFDLVSPIKELKAQIALEFDFLQEAAAMRHFHKALSKVPGVTVPLPVDGLVSRRLLIMSFVQGTPLTRLADAMPIKRKRAIRAVGKKILKRLAACYAKMVLTDGHFHADCMYRLATP